MSSLVSIIVKAADPLAAFVLSLLYPQQCEICDGHITELRHGNACGECWSKTLFFDSSSSVCEKCGAFGPDGISLQSARCGRCDEQVYDCASALGRYEMGLRRSIISLKSKPHLPGIVVRAVDERFASFPELGPDLIVPVPLSKQRRFERGFNQAEVIADVVARSTGIPVDRMSLQRKEHTKMHRAGMDRKARERTVENAFAVARPKMISGKNILLTDDVFTSGATVSACAGILKANGAQTVSVFTIARAEFRR